MRRVVVTGLGIVSSIGNNAEEVCASLRNGTSGIVASPSYTEFGFRSQVEGSLKIDLEVAIDSRTRRFMSEAAGYAYLAMDEAVRHSGLEANDIKNDRTGLIVGSGGSSTSVIVHAADVTRDKGPQRVRPNLVPKGMSSTCSAVLSTAFGIRGTNYSISSACATSSHCIGNAAELIQWGKQDVMFAGGGEELNWTQSVLFDAMGAMSAGYNATPAVASRPYDANRDGFVISGGGGMLVLEELEHARARGAKILAELVGYGASSDGFSMVEPSGEGAVRCMRQALEGVEGVPDYINPHATSTPVGDAKEIGAFREVFGDKCPPISATKALSGHSLGAAGVHEAVYSLLMLRDNFICPSAHIENLDPAFADMPIIREVQENVPLNCVLSNSFGFGGTNATLVFRRLQ